MKKVVSIFFQVVIFFLTAVVVLALTYIVARPYLIGDNLWGNDVYSYFAVVKWVNDYFPKVPFWYPLSGGGVSLVSAYPTFSAFLISLITRLTPLDLVQSFRLFGFLTVPFLAIGTFFFVLTRLTSIKSGSIRAVLGLVAAFFVVVSPNSWIWLTRWGFFAESSSYIFVPFAIIFFDLFLENVLEDKKGWGYKLGLLGTVIFTYLSFLSHFLALASLVVFFAFITLVRFLLVKENKKLVFKRLAASVLVLGTFFAGIILYKYFAYKFYMDQVAIGGFTGYGQRAWQELANNTLPLKMMLSLDKPTTIADPHALIFDTRFHLFVWILFFLGFFVSIKKSAQVFALSLYGLFGLILSSVLPLKFFVSGIPLLGTVANLVEDRGFLVVARVIVPVVAVYGAYMIWEVIIKNKFVSLILSLVLVSGLAYKLYYKPYDFKFMLGTGAVGGVLDLRNVWGTVPQSTNYLYGPDYDFVLKNPEYTAASFDYMRGQCLLMDMAFVESDSVCADYYKDKNSLFPSKENLAKTEKDCLIDRKTGDKYPYCNSFYKPLKEQLKLSSWPKFEISRKIDIQEKRVEDIFAPLPNNDNYRYDLSGFAGGVIMATPIFRNNSQLQIYINTASLVYNSWNYLGQVMYTPSNNYQKPNVLTELGKWFGLNYVYLIGSTLEPLEYWKTDLNWEDLGKWKKFTEPVTLASWSDKPTVLLITDVKRGLYDQFLRFATQGGLNYDTANLVIGKKSVDSYSLNSLKKYDVVIMRGYSYKSTVGAYKLLDNYVKEGGILLFDTGWQYEIPDFVIKKAPEFMPFAGLEWKNLALDKPFKFVDMKYGEFSWGVSAPVGLKKDAEVLLDYDGTPLMVQRSYGKGKVIWSGFNIVAHSLTKDSQAEAIFFGETISKALAGRKSFDKNIEFVRNNPDVVQFDIKDTVNNDSQIYFRESYFPYWQAKLIRSDGKSGKLEVSKAGPGFMLIDLPKVSAGDKVILSLKIGIIQKVCYFISFVAAIGLVIYLINPEILPKITIPKIKFKKHHEDEY